MPSFDVVSEVDLHDLTNAVDQANRIIGNRFDFKGVDATFTREERNITIQAEAEFQVEQMMDVLQSALIKCGIDIQSMDSSEPVESGKYCKLSTQLRHGIDADSARKIVKRIKAEKMKVQVQIQSDQVRVSGKKRDDLQQVIGLLKSADFGLPLQFTNFRD